MMLYLHELTFGFLQFDWFAHAGYWLGQVVTGFDHAIITMKKGEIALFTLPPELGYGAIGRNGVPPNCVIQLEVELISWITVVDICKDGGIIKRVMEKGEQAGPPGDLDEVLGNLMHFVWISQYL